MAVNAKKINELAQTDDFWGSDLFPISRPTSRSSNATYQLNGTILSAKLYNAFGVETIKTKEQALELSTGGISAAFNTLSGQVSSLETTRGQHTTTLNTLTFGTETLSAWWDDTENRRLATSSEYGLVKLAENATIDDRRRMYGVKANDDGEMYVQVPWYLSGGTTDYQVVDFLSDAISTDHLSIETLCASIGDIGTITQENFIQTFKILSSDLYDTPESLENLSAYNRLHKEFSKDISRVSSDLEEAVQHVYGDKFGRHCDIDASEYTHARPHTVGDPIIFTYNATKDAWDDTDGDSTATKMLELAGIVFSPSGFEFLNGDTFTIRLESDGWEVDDLSYIQIVAGDIGYLSSVVEPLSSYAAEDDKFGLIKIGYTKPDGSSDKYYAVQLDSNNRAYVEVPWVNTFIKSIEYDDSLKELCIIYTKADGTEEEVNVNIGDLVDTYYADGTTIELRNVADGSVTKKTFNVKSGVYESFGTCVPRTELESLSGDWEIAAGRTSALTADIPSWKTMANVNDVTSFAAYGFWQGTEEQYSALHTDQKNNASILHFIIL